VPDCNDEPNLVQHASQVVSQIEDVVIQCQEGNSRSSPTGRWTSSVTTERMVLNEDRNVYTLTNEDLKQDLSPSSHTNCKANPCVDNALLTQVVEGKHDDNQQKACAELWFHRLEDAVELNHLVDNVSLTQVVEDKHDDSSCTPEKACTEIWFSLP